MIIKHTPKQKDSSIFHKSRKEVMERVFGLFIFLGLIPTLTFSSPETSLFHKLEEFNRQINSQSFNQCQASNYQMSYEEFTRPSDNIEKLFKCSDVDNFAKLSQFSSYYYCRQPYGDEAWTCAETDNQKLQKRMDDLALMNKIEEFTKKTFESYKTKLAKKCCQPDQKNCLHRFEKVKLVITDSPKMTAEYVSDTAPVNFRYNDIQISKGKLASQYTEEGLERVLLHEFGHVCHFGLVAEDTELYREFTHPNTNCEAATGEKAFKVSKLESLTCVNNKLKDQMKEVGHDSKKYCFGKWYREAFADTIFRDEMNTIYHWTYDMYRRSPAKNYGKVSEYIQCDEKLIPKESVCN